MPADPARRRLFGRYYARVSPAMDAGGLAGYRQRLLAGLAGQVIEVGGRERPQLRALPGDGHRGC